MGRHHKVVLDTAGFDRRASGYYSTPAFVAEYIAKQLIALRPDAKRVFDPCVGRGELTRPFKDAGKHCFGMDIVDFAAIGLDEFELNDFIKFYMKNAEADLFSVPSTIEADIIVANPPYNCHETDYIIENKSHLTSVFGKGGVLNMYSMFVTSLIKLAKPGTFIGIITLDSFLTARGHEELRALIRNECTIHYLHLAPSDLFRSQGADVRTSIFILEKGKNFEVKAKTSNRAATTQELENLLSTEQFLEVRQNELYLEGPSDRGEMVIGVPEDVLKLLARPRLGDLFPCITGISTGNDRQYLSDTKTEKFSVPFYKNPGSKRFRVEPNAFLPDDFLKISKNVKNFMVRNKQHLFKGGITCSSMGVAFTAAFLPDNAAVGVNANIIVDDVDRWWLMAYLNSSLCTYLVRSVLLRSNMITAGYVSRIPVPAFSSDVKNALSTEAKAAYEENSTVQDKIFVKTIDLIVFDCLQLGAETITQIEMFTSDLIRRT